MGIEDLLALLRRAAAQFHAGHYAILAFTTGYKVAFGTPEFLPFGVSRAAAQVDSMPSYPTLKEALVEALITGKDFATYFDGDPVAWWDKDFATFKAGVHWRMFEDMHREDIAAQALRKEQPHV
jgi:hypothetical protein